MIEVRDVRLAGRDLRPAFKAWPGLRWWSSLPIAVLGAGVIAVMILVSISYVEGPAEWTPLVLLASFYGMIGAAWIVQRRLVRMVLARGGGVLTYRLDESGLEIAGALTFSRTDWRRVVRVVEQKDRIVFAVTPTQSYVLPRRFLQPDQLEAIRSLIAEVTASGRLGRGVD